MLQYITGSLSFDRPLSPEIIQSIPEYFIPEYEKNYFSIQDETLHIELHQTHLDITDLAALQRHIERNTGNPLLSAELYISGDENAKYIGTGDD